MGKLTQQTTVQLILTGNKHCMCVDYGLLSYFGLSYFGQVAATQTPH